MINARGWFTHSERGRVSGHESTSSPKGLLASALHAGRWSRFWLCLLIVTATAGAYELKTSRLESRLLAFYSRKLTYEIKSGPSARIVFPKDGPFDIRRGYTLIPELENRLKKRGFVISEQSSFSQDLAKLASWGVTPPYREPGDAGLAIKSANGTVLYDATTGDRRFESYQSIPPMLVDALLYIENRELGDSSRSNEDNPVVDWPRLVKASAIYAARKVGLPVRLQGGSTLATQIEKFQHSPAGQTVSGIEKFRQMLAATFTVYKQGVDTRSARQEIILDYLNMMPLAAVPGYGEVYGLGNGLYAWFGLDLDDVCGKLRDPSFPMSQARALRYALTLLVAVRAPSYYLNGHQDQLENRVTYYGNMLAKAGIITPVLAANLKDVTVRFSLHARREVAPVSYKNKAAGDFRIHLASVLGVPSLYDLDGLHLEAKSTLDTGLQEEVLHVFDRLRDRNFVGSKGLYGDHLFSPGDDLNQMIYSFLLYESIPTGNALRAGVDNLDAPFDINEGVKLQLGSTAKLRVLAHYLELMVGLYREFAPSGGIVPAAQTGQARDPLTSWAARILRDNPRLTLIDFLARSLDRSYSANPGETFFTGGGAHNFHNFEKEDDNRVLSIRVATQHSTNLVFIRLMRDIVLYHEARLPYDTDAVLNDPGNPARHTLLQQIAADEATDRLAQYYKIYRGLTPAAALAALLGPHTLDARSLAIVFFAWHPEARSGDSTIQLLQWLTASHVTCAPDQVFRLVKAYHNPGLTISDYGYLLGKHPLEVWTAGQIARESGISWANLFAHSTEACRLSSAWLFQSRNRAAQDLRLRIRFEQDAFKRMTPSWQRLGFPFDNLVPSLATAIGSSSDRPAALAELMGIIQNDGALRTRVRFEELRFAGDTPYETVLTKESAGSEQVMAKPVARLLRQVLAEVVEKGTAIRDADAFVVPGGKPIVLGGKTGSGDNRFVLEGRGGVKLSSHAVNRTATFVFYLGDRYFGVVTAFVDGKSAANYRFTSALPLAILKVLAPAIKQRLFQDDSILGQSQNVIATARSGGSKAPPTYMHGEPGSASLMNLLKPSSEGVPPRSATGMASVR